MGEFSLRAQREGTQRGEGDFNAKSTGTKGEKRFNDQFRKSTGIQR